MKSITKIYIVAAVLFPITLLGAAWRCVTISLMVGNSIVEQYTK